MLIPPPHKSPYKNGISHPDLWLWDSWTTTKDDALQLFCLALSKVTSSGTPIAPEDRNKHKFHVRRFESFDAGLTWWDKGLYCKPHNTRNGYFDRNIWSGSVTQLEDGRHLFGFTGIREPEEDRPFIQSIGLAVSSSDHTIEHVQPEPLSCPVRDYDDIIAAGYYLGPRDALGHKDGENGGPILAWRDPYLFRDKDNVINAVWSAKVSSKVGAVAHATLIETQAGFTIDCLHPPITLPDADKFTQAEVPKFYFDDVEDRYFCLIAACDRLYEGQDDSEVTKVTRLYVSSCIRGPWKPYNDDNSELDNMTHLFGGSIIKADYSARRLTFAAPYTEQAAPELMLTFAPLMTVAV